MAERYPPELDALIWTLLCDGFGPTRIRRALACDEAGLGYELDVKPRTMALRIAKLKAERGEPRPYMKPGQEGDATEAIMRAAIALQASELSRLEKKAAANGLTPADHKALDTLIRSTDEQRRRAANPESAKTRKGKQLRAGAATAPPSRLKALAREMQREDAERGAAETDASPNGNGTGTAEKQGTRRKAAKQQAKSRRD
jgi:hypothetical protein